MASTGLAFADPRVAAAAERRETAAPWRWVGTLYFAEGLPATIVASLSAIFLKQLEVPNGRIAVCVSGLMLPWTLRPLWSPLIEMMGTKRLFVLVMEVLIALGLGGLAVGLAAGGSVALCILLFAFIAVCAATHDMAADGLFIRSLSPEIQNRYVGWLGVAFNIAKLMAQGLVVVVVGQFAAGPRALLAWQAAFIVLAAVTAGLAAYHLRWLPDDEPVRRRPGSLAEAAKHTAQVVRTFFGNAGLAWLLALIALYRVAEGQLVRIAPLFLLDSPEEGGLGLSTTAVGAFYGGLGGGAFVTGAVVGGWIAGRLGEKRSLVPLCLAFNLPGVLYLSLAVLRPTLTLAVLLIAFEQLAYGIGSIGLKLATLSASRGGRYEAAHCAFAGALSGVGAVAAGMLSGTVQSTVGYPAFFGLAALVSLAPLYVALVWSHRTEPPPLAAREQGSRRTLRRAT